MGNLSRKKREWLKEVDENDLNVSLAHDDVSMTGQEGDSLAEVDKNDLNVTLAHEDVSMTVQEGVDKNGSNLTPACEDDCV